MGHGMVAVLRGMGWGRCTRCALCAPPQEFWARIKAEYAALPEQTRLHYEELARQEAIAAASASAAAASASAAVAPALEDSGAGGALVPMALDELPIVPAVGRPLGDVQRLTHLVGGFAPNESPEFPLQIERFNAWVVEEAQKFRELPAPEHSQKNGNIAKLARVFAREVGGLARGRGAIPKRVVHDRPCPSLCLYHSHETVLSVARQFAVAITRRAKADRSAANALQLCFAVEAPLSHTGAGG